MQPITGTELQSKAIREGKFARFVFIAASSVLVLSFVIALPLHFALFSNGFVTATMFFVVCFRQQKSLRNVVGLIAAAVVLAGMRFWKSGASDFLPLEPSVVAFFLGLASMWMLLLPIAWSSGPEKKLRMSEFGIVLGVSALMFMAEYSLRISTAFSPQTLDYNLYRFDAALGFQASFAIGRLLTKHRWLRELCQPAYYGLPLMFVILATGRAVSAVKPHLWKAMLAAGIIGTCLYTIVPAAGPIYVLYKYFPIDPPSPASFAMLATVNLGSGVPRNCMPSLHFGWALLIFMNVRWSRWRTVGALVLLALTVVATLGFGEHYLVDLIVAVPYAMAINSAAEKRWLLAVCCTAITFGWLVALRWMVTMITASHWVAWSLVVVTFAAMAFITSKNARISQGCETDRDGREPRLAPKRCLQCDS